MSVYTVILVGVSLHKWPFPPYQRGFFCDDGSIRLSYRNSTVPTVALVAVGVTVPVVSVSQSVAQLARTARGHMRNDGTTHDQVNLGTNPDNSLIPRF